MELQQQQQQQQQQHLQQQQRGALLQLSFNVPGPERARPDAFKVALAIDRPSVRICIFLDGRDRRLAPSLRAQRRRQQQQQQQQQQREQRNDADGSDWISSATFLMARR